MSQSPARLLVRLDELLLVQVPRHHRIDVVLPMAELALEKHRLFLDDLGVHARLLLVRLEVVLEEVQHDGVDGRLQQVVVVARQLDHFKHVSHVPLIFGVEESYLREQFERLLNLL